jgi:hypothetical protein
MDSGAFGVNIDPILQQIEAAPLIVHFDWSDSRT